MIDTSIGRPVSQDLVGDYFRTLVNRFFKILPIRESGEKSLTTYIRSLQIELIGCGSFIEPLETDASYLTLLSILQFLHDNPDVAVVDVKREVFRAIGVCNRLANKYYEGGEPNERLEHLRK